MFCPKCAYEKSKALVDRITIEVPVPISELSEKGMYNVRCMAGHHTEVTLDNLKFELLFELGVNAIVDGYFREAVASFTTSLERFYEFYYWATLLHLGVSKPNIEASWKPMANSSERQLGAYIASAMILTGEKPEILSSNSEVPFRNRVVHKGYLPDKEQAIKFGNRVLFLSRKGLDELRQVCPTAIGAAYEYMSPKELDPQAIDDEDDDSITGCVNVLTTLDVRYPAANNDVRAGSVENQFERILRERELHSMEILTEKEAQNRFPDLDLPDNSRDY